MNDFNNYRQCADCGRDLPDNGADVLCDRCHDERAAEKQTMNAPTFTDPKRATPIRVPDDILVARIKAADTRCGPTVEGRFIAYIPSIFREDAEVDCLTASQGPEGLRWTWDAYPGEWESIWTPGWACAPVGAVPGAEGA